MALQKTIEVESGVMGDYLKVDRMEYQFSRETGLNRLSVTCKLYLNEDARRSEKQTLATREYIISPALISPERKIDFSDPVVTAYGLLKLTPELSDAKDC